MKELVQFVAQQLVSHPEAVKVEETQGDIGSISSCEWPRKISEES